MKTDERAQTLAEIDEEFDPDTGELLCERDLRCAVQVALFHGNSVADVAVRAKRHEETIRAWRADAFVADMLLDHTRLPAAGSAP